MAPREPAFFSSRRLLPIFGVLLVAGILTAYHGCWRLPFVFDDLTAIPQNATLAGFRSALFPPLDTTVTGRPLVNESLALNYRLGGFDLPGYHAINVGILIAGALALFGLARRLFKRFGPIWAERSGEIAALSALIWALHPLQTESVTYLVQRAEALMGLCYLVVLYCTVRAAEAEADRAAARCWMAGAVLACWSGMAAKEVMVSAPVLAFALDRTCLAGSWRAAWRRRWGMYVPMALAWILLAVLVASTHGRSGTSGLGVQLSRLRFFRTQLWGAALYLRLSFWPSGQVFDYGTFWIDRAAQWLPAAILVLLLAATAAVAFARGKWAGWLGVWFFAVLAPTSLVFGARQTLAEHRMYLALAPVTLLAVAAAFRWAGRAAWALVAVPVVCGVLTERRNRVYSSELNLWYDTVAKVPGNSYALNNIGSWDLRAQRWAEALSYLQRSIAAKADYADAWTNLSVAQLRLGQVAAGEASLREALRLKPESSAANNDYGNLLREQGRPQDSLPYFERAIAVAPDFADAHSNYGNSLLTLGRLAEAEKQYRLALQLAPATADATNAQARNGLGLALLRSGHAAEARKQFAAALRLDAGLAIAYANDGEALKALGRLAEAAQRYTEAEARDPASGDFRYEHGNVCFKLGQRREAAALYQEAVRLNPTLAPAHYNWAVVAYQSGDFAIAEREFGASARLDPKNPTAHANYGAVLLTRGRPADALVELKIAEQLAPTTPDLAANLAAARAALAAPPVSR
jgi:tetratricopeptide (TPR) repeat protein